MVLSEYLYVAFFGFCGFLVLCSIVIGLLCVILYVVRVGILRGVFVILCFVSLVFFVGIYFFVFIALGVFCGIVRGLLRGVGVFVVLLCFGTLVVICVVSFSMCVVCFGILGLICLGVVFEFVFCVFFEYFA